MYKVTIETNIQEFDRLLRIAHPQIFNLMNYWRVVCKDSKRVSKVELC